MKQQPLNSNFNFLKFRNLYFLLSGLVIIPGIFSLITNGLKPAIDFTGGTLLEFQFKDTPVLSESQITEIVKNDIEVASVQKTGEDSFVIRAKTISNDQNTMIQLNLASASAGLKSANQASNSAQATSSGTLNELRFESVGPTLGKELLTKTFAAVILATISILLYIAYRFKNLKYGLSAILAMFHDTLILLGTFSILGYFMQVEVDTLFVTAVLTTLSFSVHDTIVVYNRIRELQEKHRKIDSIALYNKAVLETLTRSINNSMTIIFMLLALWLFGGQTTKWFVFALLVGTISGTYSSPFTAVPLLTVYDQLANSRKKHK